MSKLDEILEDFDPEMSNPSLSYEGAKQQIKELFLELIGEDESEVKAERESDIRAEYRNDFRDELRQKVEEL